jgi:uncharacterized membrane protein (DUF485 family)
VHEYNFAPDFEFTGDADPPAIEYSPALQTLRDQRKNKIVRLMIVLLTVVVIFPYLRGSSSPAFKGVSIFLGALISLGSTSAVADVVAGVILTYMQHDVPLQSKL